MTPFILGSVAASRRFKPGAAAAVTSLAQDFINRRTGAGVTSFLDFSNSANVTNFRHIDGTEANVVHNASGGILGTGCLRINIPAASGANPGSLRAPFNSAHTLVSQGAGTGHFYLQFRCKLGPGMLGPTNGGDGFKICNVSTFNPESPNSSNSNWSFEHVIHTNPSLDHIIEVYRQDGSQYTAFSNPSFVTGEATRYRLQTAIDWGAGLSDDRRYSIYNIGGGGRHSAGLLHFEEGVWITFLIHLKIASPGGTTGNEHDLWVAWPGDTDYTKVYEDRDQPVGPFSAPYVGGISGYWFTAYNTNRISAAHDTWIEYDQPICSTSFIPCPLPSETVPAWFTAMTETTWAAPATNTVSSVYSDGGYGETANSLYSWAGGSTFQSNKSLRFGPAGGHADGRVNSQFELALLAASPAWVRKTEPSVATGGTELTGVYGDGQPRGTHTWRHLVDAEGYGMWLAPTPGCYVSGANSARYHSFSETTNSWTARGYQPGYSSTDGGSDPASDMGSLYDIKTARIVCAASAGAFWTIRPDTGAASAKAAEYMGNFYTGMALSWQRRALVIWKPSAGQIHAYNIDADTIHTPADTGTAVSGSPNPGMVWHGPSGAILALGSNTATLSKLTPPSNGADTFTSSWAWSSVTPHASNAVTPAGFDTNTNHIPTLGVIRNFGGLRKDLLVAYGGTAANNVVYVMRLPRGGV